MLRLSRPDHKDPSQRRHFEISIDSPFHILSCLATQSNIYLPAYSSPSLLPDQTTEYECGCPDAIPITKPSPDVDQSNVSPNDSPSDTSFPTPYRSFTSGSGGIALPPTAHVTQQPNGQAPPRPIHLIRIPSFAPPSFDEITPPPPLITPPPDYTSLFSNSTSNGNNNNNNNNNNSPSDVNGYFDRLHLAEQEVDENIRGSSRVDVPLTPGGRINRSMDVPRDWIRVGEPSSSEAAN